MGTKLFGREARVVIGNIEIRSTSADLRIYFNVEKDLKGTPNKAQVKVWNLNPGHRKLLQDQAASGIPVSIEAGYKNATSLIFLGTLRTVATMRDQQDLVTTIESGDGEKAVQSARVSKSFAKGTSNQTILKAVALAVGVAPGNLNDAAAKLSGASIAANGWVAFGYASDEMTRICRSLDLEWSVQHGKLQILPRGRALEGKAIRLSKDTGMLGEPSIDPKGVCSMSMEIQPDVYPGRLVVVDGARLQAQIRLEQTTHSGDTRSTDAWKVDAKGKRY